MAPRPTARTRPPTQRSVSRTRLLVGLGVLLVGAAIAAIAISASGDGKSEDTAGLSQTQPVEITGTALDPLATSGRDSSVGKTAPQITGQSFDGTPVSIGNDGKAKVVMFIAHWCPHCQREVPVITQWLARNGMPSDVSLYAVATATNSDRPNYPPSAWLAKAKWPVTTLADDDKYSAAATFGLSAYPFFVAIDPAGRVVARTTGELTTAQFQQLVAAARGTT